ncbi:MAG: deoxyribonuclease IV [Thermoleophilaceae bacterium]
MLVGAHVSTAGGLVKAHERGVEMDADAIQIFNQSPRMWRPTKYKDPDIAEFRARMKDGPIRSVVIHAVYLINVASDREDVRRNSIASLKHALQVGDAIGADGVVFHPGSRKTGELEPALDLIGKSIREVLAESERTPLLLENTAGAGGTIGRTFEELADLLERGGGGKRLGVCLDCCHLLASGYDIRTADKLTKVLDEAASAFDFGRVGCIHVNDSQAPLGSNRDRHADLPEGELGTRGLSAYLSEPRFEGLPALLEVNGPGGHGPDAEQVAIAKRLRARGLGARKRAKARSGGRRQPGRPAASRRSRG